MYSKYIKIIVQLKVNDNIKKPVTTTKQLNNMVMRITGECSKHRTSYNPIKVIVLDKNNVILFSM